MCGCDSGRTVVALGGDRFAGCPIGGELTANLSAILAAYNDGAGDAAWRDKRSQPPILREGLRVLASARSRLDVAKLRPAEDVDG